ncbi:helix-turn-helix domain-containing protein [Microbacterium esteraromaticum]|uniref:Helix-turn-helix domain-containing protein n=1 Tax=Microbacterium esteraromaticum TaxID=57043 RepID=A0A7D8AJU9_9MICO|nr:helix-turn-helix domain-containing protein [Microbacterium esteraromaticum]QMU96227.1 helix-turn-helix domain-containing protein [Microbacterium esteraromaticum]
MDITARASSIGSLADETRQALYEHVVSQPDAVTREAAASAIGVPAHMARFHLDKLVEAGLLETEFRRLSGRTGPGAGRPSKLYRRAGGTLSISLPERRYDLVGHVLAGAIERAGEGTPLRDALAEVAHDEGRSIAASAPKTSAAADDETARVTAVLTAHGYEPRTGSGDDGGAVILANCPFDSLARDHTELICSANLSLLGGVLDGLDCTHLRASGEPHAGRCCVAIRPRP